MDHMTSFDTVKNQSFKNIIMSHISLYDFIQHLFLSPSSPFSRVKIMQSTLLTGASCDFLCTCSNHHNRFSVIVSSMGGTLIFSHIASFCILSFLVWSHIYLNIFISATPTFLSSCPFKPNIHYHIV